MLGMVVNRNGFTCAHESLRAVIVREEPNNMMDIWRREREGLKSTIIVDRG